MGNYYKPYIKSEEEGAKTKRVFKILGPCLLAVSVGLIIVGILCLTGVIPGFFAWIFGIIALPFAFCPVIPGVIFTIDGWSRKKLVAYIHKGGTFAEVPDSHTAEPSAVTCPNCGTANKRDSSFCKECGKPLDNGETCPYCQAKIEGDSKYCPKCGHWVK